MSAPIVELLTIGNEILAGDILDTNSHWLCRKLVAAGCRVGRITVLPDDLEVIAEALRAALARRPALILTCGGLGPTADDLTLAAVAAGLGRPLVEMAAAYAMIRDFYAALHRRGEVTTAEMTPARAKMACLPAGAEPLANRVGAAPGVLLREGTVWIASLPGVPAELKAIFEESLWPRLAAGLRREVWAERVIRTDCRDESVMAPAVDRVAAAHPDVYVKSRAQVYGGEATDFVTLAARGADMAEAQARLDAAERALRAELARVNIAVVAVEEGHTGT
ncbi:MAG: competence/damage-inducible protein A [Anaerolineae bacterium]